MLKEIKNRYLCGIGAYGKIQHYEVGTYNEERESFSFFNGDLGANELFKEPRGSNATYVVKGISLEEIEDAGLLDKYENV